MKTGLPERIVINYSVKDLESTFSNSYFVKS